MHDMIPRRGLANTQKPVDSLDHRHEVSILALILLLALVIRVAFVLQMRASPFFDHPALDQGFYVEAGHAVSRGVELRPGPVVRPPLYGWWLGLIFEIFGDSLLVPRLLQCLVGTITVWLTYQLARTLFGAWTAICTGILAATYWVLIYYDGELLRESLFNCLNLTAILWTLYFSRRSSPYWGLLAGLAWGLAALLRPQVLVVLPLLIVWLRAYSKVRMLRVLGFASAVAAPVLAITTYNWVVGGDRLLISGEGGQALWIGNNPHSDGIGQIAPGTRGDFWGGYEDTRALAELEEGRSLRPSEVSHHYVQKTWDWIRQNPLAESRLLLRKFCLMWTDWEFGSPEEPHFFASRFAPITWWLPFGFGLIASLALIGCIPVLRQGALSSFPLWGFILVYGMTVVAFIVGSRYRLPIVPFLIVLSGRGVVWIAHQVFLRRLYPLIAGVAVMSLVLSGSKLLPSPRSESTARGLMWLAISENRVGHRDAAVALFQEALALSPSYCDARTYLGITLGAMDRVDDAIKELQEAVQTCPDNVVALDSLTDLLLKRGRAKEARAFAERSSSVAPHLARSKYNLGRAFVAMGQVQDALSAFQGAVAADPGYFNAAYALGMMDLDLGRREEAVRTLAQAVAGRRDSVDPVFLLSAYRALIDALVGLGRREDALKYAQELVTRLPGNAEAAHVLEQLDDVRPRHDR